MSKHQKDSSLLHMENLASIIEAVVIAAQIKKKWRKLETKEQVGQHYEKKQA